MDLTLSGTTFRSNQYISGVSCKASHAASILLLPGLTALVINSAMLVPTAKWSNQLGVDNFWQAISTLFIIFINTTFKNSFTNYPTKLDIKSICQK